MTDEGHWVQEIKENDPIQNGYIILIA